MMKQKELGKTGVMVPEIGVGTWYYEGSADLLRKAVDLGATLIDTAEHYGTEEVVGRAIKGIRDKVFVATKVSHWRREEVLRCAESSLRKLGIDTIDLYQLHWPNATVPMEETVGAMEDLVDQGKVRFLGVSNCCIGELKRAQTALRKHRIVSNQVRYSLIERTIEPRLGDYCEANHVTVIGFSPLGHSFQRMRERDPDDALGRVGNELGKTRAQVALNWCIRHPGLITIPKTGSEAHVVENCQSSGWRLTAEQIEVLSRNIRFRRRGRVEAFCRRLARGTLQYVGKMRHGLHESAQRA
jgi:diketogulonate reductase-like aldo/keto reductase